MSGKVVTLTFDANMAPAVRKFIEAKDAIKKVKDEAKGMTTAVSQTAEKTSALSHETEKFADKQIQALRNTIGGYIGLHSVISLATSLYDSYQEKQRKAIQDSEKFLKMVSQLQAATGTNAAGGVERAQRQALTLGVSTEFSANAIVGLESTGRGLSAGRRQALGDIAARVARVRGAGEGQAGGYGALTGTSARLFPEASDAELSDALTILTGIMGPDEAERFLSQASESGATLREAVAFARTAVESKGGIAGGGNALRGIESFRKSGKLGAGRLSFSGIVSKIGGLSAGTRGKLNIDATIDATKYSQNLSQTELGGKSDLLSIAEYQQVQGPEGAAILAGRQQQRYQTFLENKTAEDARRAKNKEATDLILAQPLGTFDPLQAYPSLAPGAPVNRGELTPAQKREQERQATYDQLQRDLRESREQVKDATTTQLRSQGAP